MLCAEDDAADTIVPRLAAAGADLTRVYIVPAVERDGGGQRLFSLEHDLDLLEREIVARGDVRLVVIDPLSSCLGGTGDARVRGVASPSFAPPT
jgi:putative DNA primase/helicase